MNTYAAMFKNDLIREESSSGGLFSAVAKRFDVIYGASMTDDCYEVKMIRVESDVSPLRGSKYLQAKVGECFRNVKKDLLDGKMVLFSGTGCQINGLSLYLGKEYSNLFLLDIVCHGTPSPKLWKEYTKYIEGKFGKIKNINFRHKWNTKCDKSIDKNQIYVPMEEDSYMRMFLRNYCLRPACYECHAKNLKKSDMTIADFWGVNDVAPEINDGRGISLVIARTKKGKALFEEMKPELIWKEVNYQDGVRNNSAEYVSVERPPQRDRFFEDLRTEPFEKMEMMYAANIKVPLKRKLIIAFKNKIRRIIYLVIKRNPDVNYGILFTFYENND